MSSQQAPSNESAASGHVPAGPSQVPAAFIDELTRVMSPSLQECFSKETKKLRLAVLAVAMLLFLLGVNAITFSGRGEFAGLAFDKIASSTLKGTAAIVESFFVLVLVARSYVEWAAWRLKSLNPEWGLLQLSKDLVDKTIAWSKDMELAQNELEALAARRVVGAGARQATIVLDQVKAIEARLARLAEDPDAKKRLAMSELLHKYVLRASLARKIRLWLEAFFPVCFGIASILVVIVRS
jgi:hypothetical protein